MHSLFQRTTPERPEKAPASPAVERAPMATIPKPTTEPPRGSATPPKPTEGEPIAMTPPRAEPQAIAGTPEVEKQPTAGTPQGEDTAEAASGIGLAAVVGAPLRAALGSDVKEQEQQPEQLVARDERTRQEEQEASEQQPAPELTAPPERKEPSEEKTDKAVRTAGSVARAGERVPPAFVEERAPDVDVDALFKTDAHITELKRRCVHEAHELERHRTRFYSSQLRVNGAYWQALLDLVHSNEARTDEALRYLTLKEKVLANYADSLYALDDKLHGLKPGAGRARTEGGSRRSGAPLRAAANVEQAPGQGREPSPVLAEAPRPINSAGDLSPEGLTVVDQLCEIDAGIALSADGLAGFVSSDVLGAIMQPMVQAVSAQLRAAEEEGDALLATMSALDSNAADMYAAYQETIKNNMEYRETGQEVDLWLADASYRVAVLSQTEAWEAASVKIAQLFEEVKQLELRRRRDTQRALRLLVQRQHEVLDPCQPMDEQEALQALDAISLDPDTIERDTRERARASNMYRERPAGEDLSEAHAALARMPEPMESALIRHCGVVEHYKGPLTNKHWGVELAILTWDSNLLFFKAPKHVNPQSSAAFAFKQVVANRVVTAAQQTVAKKPVAGLHRLPKAITMVPDHSLNMADSAAHELEGTNRQFKHAFEVVSTTKASGVTSTIKEKSSRKMIVRTSNDAATEEWIIKIAATEGVVVGDEDRLREVAL